MCPRFYTGGQRHINHFTIMCIECSTLKVSVVVNHTNSHKHMHMWISSNGQKKIEK